VTSLVHFCYFRFSLDCIRTKRAEWWLWTFWSFSTWSLVLEQRKRVS